MIDYNTASPADQQLNHHHPQQHMGYLANPPPGANHPSSDNYFGYNTETSNGGMRPNFPLNTAPLAALHSMTGGEMKTSPSVSSPSLAGYNPAAYYSMKNYLNGTPHGITDILSRPDLQALQARLGQGMYYNSCSQAGTAGMSPTQKDGSRHPYWTANGQEAPPNGHQPEWTSKQGYPGMLAPEAGGKESKKKNTRPTFSGSQIFALEKTFEQQKYLAGPERGRLAYALGMSEGQVKVWFQNRRTKWRKRHAAEMSSKRRADSSSSTNASSPYEEPPAKQSHMSHQEFNPNNMSADMNGTALHM